MPMPEFLRALRERVGHAPLFLSGVAGVVLDAEDRLLLTRRSDLGYWALPSGIVEPGEQPARTLHRELGEECDVTVRIEGLVSLRSGDEVRYPNGDRASYLTALFRCRLQAGTARVADEESTAVGWFAPAALEELHADGVLPAHQLMRAREGLAWQPGEPARFDAFDAGSGGVH